MDNTLKNTMTQSVIPGAMSSMLMQTREAIVTATDVDNNACSIIYNERDGYTVSKKNVPIRLYGKGSDWFPKNGEKVVIELQGESCTVVARNIPFFDVKKLQRLQKDIVSDESACIETDGTIG